MNSQNYVVRAVPDGKTHQTVLPELKTMSRNDLAVHFNRCQNILTAWGFKPVIDMTYYWGWTK